MAPALFSGAAGPQAEQIGLHRYGLVACALLVGQHLSLVAGGSGAMIGDGLLGQ
ncbi:MAG: hypothetical protein R3E79_33050 [Caldilineaceae bacterium]